MLNETANNLSLKQVSSQVNENTVDIDSLYVQGIAYLNNHEDRQAKEKFLQILKLDPSSLEANWGIAEFQRRIYKYDIAETTLRNIIQENPDFSSAYISLAYLKYMQADFEEVIKLMGIVINQGLKNTDVITHVRAHCLYAGGKGMLAYLGGTLSKLINGPAVLRHLKIAQKLAPESAAVHFGLECYHLLKPEGKGHDLKKAEKYLKQAIKIDPLFADAYVRLSQVNTFLGNTMKAKIFLRKALEIDPGNLLAEDIISNKCEFICEWK